MGGVDSIVLLNLFSFTNNKIFLAYCNYYLRFKDNIFEIKFIKNISYIYRYKTFIKYFFFKKKKNQESYRNLRYKWFKKICIKYNINYLILAHNLNDNIETSFMNFIRGTSIYGIKNMYILNKNIFRPLLLFNKKSIYLYAFKKKLQWKEDISNYIMEYKRNIIRKYFNKIFKFINFNRNNINKTYFFLKKDINFINFYVKNILYNNSIILVKKKYLRINIKLLLIIKYYKFFLIKYFLRKKIKDIILIFNLLKKNIKKIIIFNNINTIFLFKKNKKYLFIIKKKFLFQKYIYYKIFILKKKIIKIFINKYILYFLLNKSYILYIRNMYILDFFYLKKKKINILKYFEKKIDLNNMNLLKVLLLDNIIFAIIFNNIIYNIYNV
ncbi:MAG: tRNA lysidine(34) synthetase TilS [Candidatus Shikimatogenerans sp. Tduv]|uniref:tRNA(Ile)-lysidine synthetase n=1 Tax=Candidatus Shikimatogenerans sp. Tduv TaxID=3158567 RepID=A0AAU7QRU4_9FLAO